MNLDSAAHWAELISAVVSTCTVLGVAWKLVSTANAIIKALHEHKEHEGYLRAENIRPLFRSAP